MVAVHIHEYWITVYVDPMGYGLWAMPRAMSGAISWAMGYAKSNVRGDVMGDGLCQEQCAMLWPPSVIARSTTSHIIQTIAHRLLLSSIRTIPR